MGKIIWATLVAYSFKPPPNSFIRSATAASRSEASAESEDPYVLLPMQRRRREFCRRTRHRPSKHPRNVWRGRPRPRKRCARTQEVRCHPAWEMAVRRVKSSAHSRVPEVSPPILFRHIRIVTTITDSIPVPCKNHSQIAEAKRVPASRGGPNVSEQSAAAL
jgi:hypothetical protein